MKRVLRKARGNCARHAERGAVLILEEQIRLDQLELHQNGMRRRAQCRRRAHRAASRGSTLEDRAPPAIRANRLASMASDAYRRARSGRETRRAVARLIVAWLNPPSMKMNE